MGVLSEPLLIVLGIGIAAFGLAVMAIASASAHDAIKRHMVHVRAMEMRNAYLRTVLSLQGAMIEVDEIDAPEPAGTVTPPADDTERLAA